MHRASVSILKTAQTVRLAVSIYAVKASIAVISMNICRLPPPALIPSVNSENSSISAKIMSQTAFLPLLWRITRRKSYTTPSATPVAAEHKSPIACRPILSSIYPKSFPKKPLFSLFSS